MNYNYLERIPNKNLINIEVIEDDRLIIKFDDGSCVEVKVLKYDPSLSELITEEIDNEILSKITKLIKDNE